MRTIDLYHAFHAVDDDILERSEAAIGRRKKNGWLKWGTIAACLCLCVVGAISIFYPKGGSQDSVVQAIAALEFNGCYYEVCNIESVLESCGLPNKITAEMAGEHLAYLEHNDGAGYEETAKQTDIELYQYAPSPCRGVYVVRDGENYMAALFCNFRLFDSNTNVELSELYKMFGINAELLIDHAWGYEPCTMADIKAYKPSNNSIGSGQVLHCPYDFNKAKLIVREMADLLALDLVDKGLVTDQIVLTVGYDIENLNTSDKRKAYKGEVTTDYYGRKVPKHAHGTINLERKTSSTKDIVKAAVELYDRIVNKDMLIRRAYIVANHVIDEKNITKPVFEQLDLFTDYETVQKQRAADEKERQDEKNVQKTILDIKKKYGKNAIIKGMNLADGATTIERNGQIGGHKS